MVLGILTAIAACPAIIGTTEAVRQGQRSKAREGHRGRKSNLIASCVTPSRVSSEVNGGTVVLCNNKVRNASSVITSYIRLGSLLLSVQLYIATPTTDGLFNPSGHPFAGYFLPYPDEDWGRKGEGLVSTITDEPPQLNWIYVDQDTGEVKYGLRAEAENHLVGPWDCTRIDKRLTLEGWEGFMAVKAGQGPWALYFDQEDNGLKGKVAKCQILQIELTRKEMRMGKVHDEE
jgi:hypothetical protein